jgi:hypothetical protein
MWLHLTRPAIFNLLAMDFTTLPDHTLDQLISFLECGLVPPNDWQSDQAISEVSTTSTASAAHIYNQSFGPTLAELERERDLLLMQLGQVNAAIAARQAPATL